MEFNGIWAPAKLIGEKEKLQIRNNKKIAIAIAILLTISKGASLMLIPNANGHLPPLSIPSIAFCNV
jgi:hypothetical protein